MRHRIYGMGKKNMAMIYFLCGLPSSGKTTLAKWLETEKEAARLTLDERMIAKYDYSIHDEEYGRLPSMVSVESCLFRQVFVME